MSRYDKRASGAVPSGTEDRPSLKSFQQDVERKHKDEETKRLAAHQAAVAAQQDLVKPVTDLIINDEETVQDDDPRTLQVSRSDAPPPASAPSRLTSASSHRTG